MIVRMQIPILTLAQFEEHLPVNLVGLLNKFNIQWNTNIFQIRLFES
jgi:hypothetical protein